MNITGIHLTLLVGRFLPLPAPPDVTEALSSVTVTRSDDGRSTFQLQFNADRPTALALPDFEILYEQIVAIGNRVIVMVTMDSLPTVLIDGIITTQDLSHQRETGMSSITATGEDLSVLLDLHEYSMSYPGAGDPMMVEMVLAKYAEYGIEPVAMPTTTDEVSDELEYTPQQNETDLAYVTKLAQKHGFIFNVTPTYVPGVNTAYWGPPPRLSLPQSALTVDMGSSTNVETISFTYNGLAAQTFVGLVDDDEVDEFEPIVDPPIPRLPPLALEPAIVSQGLFVKTYMYTDPRWDEPTALAFTQALTNRAMDHAVDATGTLDTLRYNGILEVPGLVGVRGAGFSYDGIYYVSAVTHTIARGSYKQQFTISREGVGATVPVVVP